MNIIGKKHIFLSLSGLLVLASIAAIALWGLRLGIDFTGGSLLEIEFMDRRPEVSELKQALEPVGLGNVTLQPTGERGVILRFRHADENTHQKILSQFSKFQIPSSIQSGTKFQEKRFDTIGPTIGQELRRKALLALAIAVIAIILYIAWAFRKVSSPPTNALVGGKPVPSWKYGMVAVLALIHDVLIPTGVFAALGEFRGVEVDTLFITALLTIMGFSVHDTIVVFDRIRENLLHVKSGEPYAVTVNRSINETIARSVNTSLTVILVLLAIFFLGGESTKYFALALILGIFFGTYSSIFVASPLLVMWNYLTKTK